MIDIDKLTSVGVDQAAADSFSVTDRVQHLPTVERRLLAVASTFLSACLGLGIDPRRLLEVSDRYIHDADRRLRPEYRGQSAYFANEGDTPRRADQRFAEWS